MSDKIYYFWSDLDFDIQKITNWLAEANFKPDLIVGLVRGGAIPAVILSHKIDVPVKLIDFSFRDSKKQNFRALDEIAISASHGKKILVIDDIVDSGKTLREVKDRMFDTKNNVVYTSLWFNPSQDVTLNYWCRVVDRSVDERWVIFPWETS